MNVKNKNSPKNSCYSKNRFFYNKMLDFFLVYNKTKLKASWLLACAFQSSSRWQQNMQMMLESHVHNQQTWRWRRTEMTENLERKNEILLESRRFNVR